MKDRYVVPEVKKKGQWPLIELRAVYKCQLCDSEHVALARATGTINDPELAKQMLQIVKVDLINKFFQEHPKAKVEEFVIGLVRAVESITYEQGGEIEKDDIGIPWVPYDIERVSGRKATVGEEKSETEKPKEKEEGKKEAPVKLKAEDKSPLADLEKMSFADLSADGMEKIFRQKLKEVKEREDQLKIQVMLLSHERVKLETMITAIEAVEKQKREDAEEEKNKSE